MSVDAPAGAEAFHGDVASCSQSSGDAAGSRGHLPQGDAQDSGSGECCRQLLAPSTTR